MNTFLQAFHSAMHTMIKEKYSHNKILDTLKPWDLKAKELRLKRDQHAYKEMKFTLLHHIAVYETSACYEYQGRIYSVQKLLKTKQPALSVEHLYTLNLTQDDWDLMERGTVWNLSEQEIADCTAFTIYSPFHKKDY